MREFRPKGGFSHSPVQSIRISDDGMSYEVLADGTVRECSTINRFNQSVPTWSLIELERLVASGAWEDITPIVVDEETADEPAIDGQ